MSLLFRQQAIDYFIKEYPIPSEVQYHRDDMGNILPCCSYARQGLLVPMRMCAKMSGILGALELLSSKVGWGVTRVSMFCDIVAHLDALDCKASAALAADLIESVADDLNGNIESIQVYRAQVIFKCSQEDGRLWKSLTFRKKRNSTTNWIQGEFVYHECIGFAVKGKLSIWDYGELLLPPSDVCNYESVQAVRICPTRTVIPECTVTWEEIPLVVNHWVIFDKAVQRKTVELNSNLTVVNIFVTGCYMGVNPCPGVGVAKAAKEYEYETNTPPFDTKETSAEMFQEWLVSCQGISIVTTAVSCGEDTTGMTDSSSFDCCIPVEVMNLNLRACKLERWSTLQRLVMESCSRSKAPVFIIPVSIAVTAVCVYVYRPQMQTSTALPKECTTNGTTVFLQ